MNVLRLEPRGGRGLDRALGAVERATLIRRADGRFVELADGTTELVRALALAGIAAYPEPSAVGLGAADLLHVRRVPLGVATALVLRRRFARWRRPSSTALERCRALLGADDFLFSWERQEQRAKRRLGMSFAREGRIDAWTFG